jgi:uncharacterized protein
MYASHASVVTSRASNLLQQLYKHFAHRLPVSFTPAAGRIAFSIGTCRLAAAADMLTLHIEAEDATRLVELQGVVGTHLLRFAFRDPPAIAWHPDDGE